MRAPHFIRQSLDATRSLTSLRRWARAAANEAPNSVGILSDAAKGVASAIVLTGVRDSALVRSLLLRRFPRTIGVASSLILLGAVCWKATRRKEVPHPAAGLARRSARTARRLGRESRRSTSRLDSRGRTLEVSPIHK